MAVSNLSAEISPHSGERGYCVLGTNNPTNCAGIEATQLMKKNTRKSLDVLSETAKRGIKQNQNNVCHGAEDVSVCWESLHSQWRCLLMALSSEIAMRQRARISDTSSLSRMKSFPLPAPEMHLFLIIVISLEDFFLLDIPAFQSSEEKKKEKSKEKRQETFQR